MTRPHYRLRAWQLGMELVKAIYQRTATFLAEELFGLTSQMRRAAVSIPSNIVEGAARNGSKEFMQFIGVAKGSLSELETQLLISVELGYVKSTDDVFQLVAEVSRLLAGLQKSIGRRQRGQITRLLNHSIT